MNLLVVALGFAVAASAGPPQFVAWTTDGKPQSGAIQTWADGTVTLSDPRAEIAAASLVSLRRYGRPLPAWPRGPQGVLANGDRVACAPVGGDGQRVLLRSELSADGKPWAVPLTALAALWVVPPPGDTPPDPAKYPWRDPARKGDAILLRNGDTITGTVEAVSPDETNLRLAADGPRPARTVGLATVAAVAFDPALARARKPKGPFYRVVAADGSRFSASDISSDGSTLSGTTTFGTKFRLPLSDVAAVDVLQGKAAYLSDLKPKASVEGYNGVAWPWAADRTAKGNPLRLSGPDGGTLDKGLGTHPRTVLTYDLGGKYRRFEAWVGLDPATGRRGSAVCRILVDGKEVPVAGLGELTSAAASVVVRVDVSGAKELTLVTDFGPAGDVRADVNWADARLVE